MGCCKEFIIWGGYNIDLVMIEELLYCYLVVQIVVVIGCFDVYVGELLVVYVQLKVGVMVIEMEFDMFICGMIGECVVILKWIYIVDVMLFMVVGKIFKFEFK